MVHLGSSCHGLPSWRLADLRQLDSRTSLSNMCQLSRLVKRGFETDSSTTIASVNLVAHAWSQIRPPRQTCHEINDFGLLSLLQQCSTLSLYPVSCSSSESSSDNSQTSPPDGSKNECDLERLRQQLKATDDYLRCFRKASCRNIAVGGFSSVYQVEFNHCLISEASTRQTTVSSFPHSYVLKGRIILFPEICNETISHDNCQR